MLSRRQFLAAAALFDLRRAEPELILHNANILTMDARHPRAQAVAIAGGRFLAVGSNGEVRALATAHTKQIDLEGKTVVPGFIDAHTHPAYAGLRHLRWVDCDRSEERRVGKECRSRWSPY